MSRVQCANVQVHVKSVEKGHSLAAQKAASSSPATLYPANPGMLHPGLASNGRLAAPQAAPQSQGWGGYSAMGKAAPEEAQTYSPRGYRGLDGIGQALSAALQVFMLQLLHQLHIMQTGFLLLHHHAFMIVLHSLSPFKTL